MSFPGNLNHSLIYLFNTKVDQACCGPGAGATGEKHASPPPGVSDLVGRENREAG